MSDSRLAILKLIAALNINSNLEMLFYLIRAAASPTGSLTLPVELVGGRIDGVCDDERDDGEPSRLYLQRK